MFPLCSYDPDRYPAGKPPLIQVALEWVMPDLRVKYQSSLVRVQAGRLKNFLQGLVAGHRPVSKAGKDAGGDTNPQDV